MFNIEEIKNGLKPGSEFIFKKAVIDASEFETMFEELLTILSSLLSPLGLDYKIQRLPSTVKVSVVKG